MTSRFNGLKETFYRIIQKFAFKIARNGKKWEVEGKMPKAVLTFGMFQNIIRNHERGLGMVTIWDVARAAGVSKSTVSLVVNNSPLVKKETRERVQAVIKAMHYVPNYNARSLIKKSNNCIGIVHALRHNRVLKQAYEWNYGLEQFSKDIEDGIFEAIMSIDSDSDLSVVKEHFYFSPDAGTLPKIFQNHRVDGAIILGGFADADAQAVVEAVEIPMVLVTSPLDVTGVDTVFHDPLAGSYLAMREFIRTGHRHICLLNCPRSYQVWPKRIEGVRRAAKEYRYSLEEELLLAAEENTAESAHREFSGLLRGGRMPDAVLAANGEMALGVLRCLYERRLRVPDDISLICYEDSSLCGNISPAMSAINIQKELIGRTALGFLLDRINSPKLPARSVVIEPHLTMRASVLDRRK